MEILAYKTKEIETSRLILKKGIEDDFIEVYKDDELLDENQVNIRTWFNTGIDDYYYDIETKRHNFDWIVFSKEYMLPIGSILVTNEEEGSNSCILSYKLRKDYCSQVDMEEAVKGVITYLFEIGYENITSEWDSKNIIDKNINEKLGFLLVKTYDNFYIKDGEISSSNKSSLSVENWNKLNKKNYR